MSLSEIKQKLYQKKTDDSLPEFVPEKISHSPEVRSVTENPIVEDAWEAPSEKLIDGTRKRWIKVGLVSLGGVLLAVAIFFGVFKFIFSSFSAERVSVSITGNSDIKNGKLVSFEINYKNDNRIALNDAVLEISYPETFKPVASSDLEESSETGGTVKLGTLGKNSEGKFVLSGRAYSPKGALMYIKATLNYTPSNFGVSAKVENQFSFNVAPSPIIIDITYSQSVNSGDEVNYLINYNNSGDEDFSNIKIRAQYPDGFDFISSGPDPMEGNNVWYVGNLVSGGRGQLTIKGRLKGERNEVKPLELSIGVFENEKFIVYNEEEADIKIAASPLFISQNINGSDNLSINADDYLDFEIFFRNDGSVSLRNVIVTEKLSGSALDFSTLKLEGGAYNAEEKTITWKAVDYPILKNIDPGQNGTIRFSIRVKGMFPVENINDKNFIVESLAKIDSPDISTPIAANKIISSNFMTMKVNSKIALTTLGYYKDATIANSGPLPPQVGKETTYAIHWKLVNVNNDLENVKVETSLPSGVFFTGKVSPENENLEYNDRTGSLIWNVGKLASGVGVLSVPREIAFQIKINPSIQQVGQSLDILKKSIFSAKDSFTGATLSTESKTKTTSLLEDSSVGAGTNSKVVGN